MRLLIAVLDEGLAGRVRDGLYAQAEHWDITIAKEGREALSLAMGQPWHLMLLHACLPGLDGTQVLSQLWRSPPLCPPRILYLWEWDGERGRTLADCAAPFCADSQKLCRLLCALAEKPLPLLATALAPQIAAAVEGFLDELSMSREWKGRAYAAWILRHYVPSPLLAQRPVSAMYAACAKANSTTPAAVERCLRVAVEGVFTLGSIHGIERYFGATVDPERGKPTNRAFLIQAAQQLRLLLGGGSFGKEQGNAP